MEGIITSGNVIEGAIMRGNDIWSTISNIASIVTCIAFILYLAGHIWAIFKNKHTIYEKITVLPYDSKIEIEDEDNFLIVDTNGCEFTIQSDYGINSLKVYKVAYRYSEDNKFEQLSKKFKCSFDNLNKEKLYIRCNLGEVFPTTQFEIKRADYTTITFDLIESGKNGHIIICNPKVQLTLKGLIYHLCA